jgi:phage/plasmid-associated DNA primase
MDVFNFKNGVIELRTGLFRERTSDDYFTITLDYDYKFDYAKQILEKIKKIILQICNDDIHLMECYLSWLGYCMTGETSFQKAMWSIGPTAQNGKTTIIEAFEQMAQIYCVKLNSKTFEEKFQNKHKQLALLKLARLAYLEEMERKSIDIQAYKDYAGGKKIGGNEILYGTAESIRINFKLMFISNKFPKFKSDAGVKRRGLCIEHTNLFYDDKKYEANKHKKGVYLKDSSLGELFERDDYKLAFFHLLIPYAIRYYKSKFSEVDMSLLIETWETICCENDDMGQFLDENYDITGNDEDRIHKDAFLKHYQNYYNLKNITWNTLINDVKRLGLEYDRTKRIDSKRGVILGLVKKQNTDQYNYVKSPNTDIDFLCEEDDE